MSIVSRALFQSALLAAAAATGVFAAPQIEPYVARVAGASADVLPSWVAEPSTMPYDAQRVIYHVNQGGGLLNRNFKHVLQVAENHAAAVSPGQLDLRVVLQGDGVDLLAWARKDAAIAARVDALKAKGVHFEVCRNTLVSRRINPDARLHGVAREDVVASSVGEVAALDQAGYVDIKP